VKLASQVEGRRVTVEDRNQACAEYTIVKEKNFEMDSNCTELERVKLNF
jgi:hypothetical protein